MLLRIQVPDWCWLQLLYTIEIVSITFGMSIEDMFKSSNYKLIYGWEKHEGTYLPYSANIVLIKIQNSFFFKLFLYQTSFFTSRWSIGPLFRWSRIQQVFCEANAANKKSSAPIFSDKFLFLLLRFVSLDFVSQ